MLLGLAAGVLAQAARLSMDSAFRAPAGQQPARHAAAAILAGAALTAVAARFAG